MVTGPIKNEEQLLDAVNFFQAVNEVDDTQFRVLLNMSRERDLQRGEILLQEGTTSKELFFVVEGQLGVYVYEEDSHKHIQIGLIRPGEMIGELSLAMEHNDRLATVRVVSETAKLVSFRQETFTNRQRYPELKDDVHFIFWRDLIQSLKWRVDLFEMKYGESPRIEELASRARVIRREVPSVHSFTFDAQGTLEKITEQAGEIAEILTQCNRLVADHRALEID